MYHVSHYVIRKTAEPDLYEYFNTDAIKCWHLYNAALFRIRQIFTGWDKPSRSRNESDVFDEIKLLEEQYSSIRVKRVISYAHLEKLMRVTENPDFFSGLPMQTAQAQVRQAVQDFKSWLRAIKDYHANPARYTGKPKMPKYKKSLCTFSFTNQDAVIQDGCMLKMPLTHIRFAVTQKGGILKEVKVSPYYGRYILSLTFEVDHVSAPSAGTHLASIDFGTDNFAALVCTDGTSRLYKGGAVLSEKQGFEKEKARAISMITKGHPHMHAASRHLDHLSFHCANFVSDQLHKISRSIISYCQAHCVSILVLGKNRLWKQHVDLGKANNQKFVQMPIAKLIFLIEYKAARAGIQVLEAEESYTSAASFIDNDSIPVYGVNDEEARFSGKRLKRGLYRAADGTIVNADLNGAANILRKAVPWAWKNRACMSLWAEYEFLKFPEVLGFHELNPLCIPVKRIVAV